MVKHYLPKMVDLHNYIPAHSVAQKLYNWETLNRMAVWMHLGVEKVLRKIHMQVSKADVDQIVNCIPEAVERVLKLLQAKAPLSSLTPVSS